MGKAIEKTKEYYDTHKRKFLLGTLLTILIIMFLFARNMRYIDPKEIEEEHPPQNALSIREDIAGKRPVILERGSYTVGIHIPPGRYSATTIEHSFGGLIVYELGTKIPELSEIIGVFSETAYVNSIALTLIEGQEIKLDGQSLQSVTFTPLKTEFRTELTAGIWEVGLDIEPGTYTVTSKEGIWGSITILEDIKPIGFASFNDENQSAVLTLNAGQIIRIKNMPTVSLEKK